MTEEQYSWPSASPGVRLRLEQAGGGDQPLRGYSGPWAVFQLLSGSDRHVSGANQFGLVNVQAGRRSLPQSVLPDGSAIMLEVVEFPNGVQRASTAISPAYPVRPEPRKISIDPTWRPVCRSNVARAGRLRDAGRTTGLGLRFRVGKFQPER
jgi:hypothetical protein